LQAAFYLDLLANCGHKDANFVFVAVEKIAPYGVQVFEASDDFIKQGRAAYRQALKLWAECQKKVTFLEELPAYSEDIVEISVPEWA
jgi:hypothetical protein